MKKVGIPYQIREGKLYMPPVAWPQCCPCCGSEQANSPYHLECKARLVSAATASTTTSTYYPLEWQVPYCEHCKAHMELVNRAILIAIAVFFILPITLTLALGKASDGMFFVLALLGGAAIAVILYQILLRVMVRSKMAPTCANFRNAIYASDEAQRIFFHFHRDEQAWMFAQLNHAELMDDIQPTFWTLRRQQ
jgi:hypothetical protein